MDDERMRPGHWLGLMLCVPFTAMILMVGWQEGHAAYKNTIPLIPIVSVPQNVLMPSVLRHCWLGSMKGIRPVKSEW